MTYIQSGNVIFKAGAALASRIPTLIASGIQERFGYRVPLVVQTVEELREVARGNPFLCTGVDPERLHVAFLADFAEGDRASQLDPDRSPPDAFQLRGREIFLYCPNGLGERNSPMATSIRSWRLPAQCGIGGPYSR